MNKISALEAYKVSVIIEDVTSIDPYLIVPVQAFLPRPPQVKHGWRDDWDDVSGDNESDGPAKQVRKRVRKACDPAIWAQGSLQQAQAGGRQAWHSGKIFSTYVFKRVAKDLKESTRILCRQLQENPDVEGNQKKIKQDKVDLMYFLEQLMVFCIF